MEKLSINMESLLIASAQKAGKTLALSVMDTYLLGGSLKTANFVLKTLDSLQIGLATWDAKNHSSAYCSFVPHGGTNKLMMNGVVLVQTNNFPENTILVVEQKAGSVSLEPDWTSCLALDITLRQNGKEIQPEETLEVSIPVPEGLAGNLCSVYRQEADSSRTNMNVEYKNGRLVFETDHLSVYIVAEEGNKDITAAFTDPNFLASVRGVIGKYAPVPIYAKDVAGITGLNLNKSFDSPSKIQSLAGLEYFTSLASLSCRNNQLTELPPLPDSLRSLDCYNNLLAELPKLPDSLEHLSCSINLLTSLPILPDGLTTLECGSNKLTELPALPDGLVTLLCGINQLTELPALPDSLKTLTCNSNQLTALPELPGLMTMLSCWGNQITALPTLPDSLTNLVCSENLLSALPPLPSSLQELSCRDNQLTSIDVTGLALTRFDCRYNNMVDESAVIGFTGEWGADYFYFPHRIPTPSP